jgi:mannose-6-phosphate isomerase-like protein (cupin superfamily)
MKTKKINDVIVNKPWGKEHCIYECQNLAIWHLTINPQKKTSLHCHPSKKTALILLNNKAKVNLIERSFDLTGLSKIMLRQGMFHQTENISDERINLIEVETPNNKFDLVRIEDDYGRKNQAFESRDLWEEKTELEKNLIPNEHRKINGLNFKIQKFKDVLDLNYSDDSIVVILDGFGFLVDSNNGLCETGEALTIKIVKFLNERFRMNEDKPVLVIWK